MFTFQRESVPYLPNYIWELTVWVIGKYLRALKNVEKILKLLLWGSWSRNGENTWQYIELLIWWISRRDPLKQKNCCYSCWRSSLGAFLNEFLSFNNLVLEYLSQDTFHISHLKCGFKTHLITIVQGAEDFRISLNFSETYVCQFAVLTCIYLLSDVLYCKVPACSCNCISAP